MHNPHQIIQDTSILDIIATWVTMVGTLVGVAAAIFGFYTLWRENKKRKNEVNDLAKIATNLGEQLVAIKGQTSALDGTMKSHVQARKNQIKPFFKIDKPKYHSPSVMTIAFKNTGEKAVYSGVKHAKLPDNTTYGLGTKVGQLIENTDHVHIDIKSPQNVRVKDSKFSLIIEFKDIENTMYHQEYIISGPDKKLLSPPYEPYLEH